MPSSSSAAASSGAGDKVVGVNDVIAEVPTAAGVFGGAAASSSRPRTGPAQHTRSLPARWTGRTREFRPPAWATSGFGNDGPSTIAATASADYRPAGIPATDAQAGLTSDAVVVVESNWRDCVWERGRQLQG